jgi:hypothetical protein
MLAFRDVVVTPYTDLLGHPGGPFHRGGPHWPAWETQSAARHCRGGSPHDVEPYPAEPTSKLTGPVAWGGAVVWHFGHQILDFTTRLLPTLAELPHARFAYGSRDRAWLEAHSKGSAPDPTDLCFTSIEETPTPFRAILDWYGIEHDRIDLISEPTLVERLDVAPQSEQRRGPGPEPWYLDLLDANTKARIGEPARDGSLYVSRAGQHARFAGESYLEEVFEEAGFRVVRPETISLEQQLRAYAGAQAIVFAEGSAVHGLQLLGRGLGDVTILRRRVDGRWEGGRWEEGVGRLLTPRSRSLRFVNALRGHVHGMRRPGQPFLVTGLSILDPESLLAELPFLLDVWDRQAYERARDSDVAAWREQERASERGDVPGSAELIAENLRAAGLGHIV